MTLAWYQLLIAAAGVLGLGRMAQAILTKWLNRAEDRVDLVAQMQTVWSAEATRLSETIDALRREADTTARAHAEQLRRLTAEVDRLQSLATALEAEVIALGGDPRRIRGRYPTLDPEGL